MSEDSVMSLGRREFSSKRSVRSTFSLFDTLFARRFRRRRETDHSTLAGRHQRAGHEVKDQIKQLGGKKIEELYAQVDLADLLRFIDFEKPRPRSISPIMAQPTTISGNGRARKLVFGKQMLR
jgi:hypothetical protein